MSDLIDRQAAIDAMPERIFQEIVVEYPPYTKTYSYNGKPYFSIKYIECGQEFIGFGTYKPEVLSEYLKKYFMPSAQPDVPERNVGKWIKVGDNSYRCSVCGEVSCCNGNFCPDCGVDMRERRTDAD